MEDLLIEYEGEEYLKEITNEWLNGFRMELRGNNDEKTNI